MFYCPNCENILDITRSVPKKLSVDEATPESVSDTEVEAADDGLDYEDILKRLEQDKDITDDELSKIDIQSIVKAPYYKKMQNKGKLKRKLMDMIEDMTNSDSDIFAYHSCSKCGYNTPIKAGYHVLTKLAEGSSTATNYEDQSKYRNLLYSKTLPRTRDFDCPNKKCPSVTGSTPREAIFFRKKGTYETIYGCTVCHVLKSN